MDKRHPQHRRGDHSYVLLTLTQYKKKNLNHPLIDPTVSPFRGEDRSAPRGAFLHFRSIDDARVGLRVLRGA